MTSTEKASRLRRRKLRFYCVELILWICGSIVFHVTKLDEGLWFLWLGFGTSLLTYALYDFRTFFAGRVRFAGMAIRWYSTIHSSYEAEVSLLAIVETFGAMLLAVWFAIAHETWLHITVSAFVAPLLLLRTERSSLLALQWWDRILSMAVERPVMGDQCIASRETRKRQDEAAPARDDSKSTISSLLAFIIPGVRFVLVILPLSMFAFSFYLVIIVYRYLVAGLTSILAKLFATSTCLVCHPLETLRSIPSNWLTTMFCVDMLHPPEPVPGLERHLARFPAARIFSFSSFAAEAMADTRPSSFVSRAPFFVLMYGPALAYRLSLKSTGLIWLPLLWIASRTSSRMALRTRLKLVVRDSFSRLVFWFSWLFLALFVLKLGLYNGLVLLARIWDGLWFSPALDFYVEQYKLPPWQLAAALNAVIGILIFLFASRQLLLIEDGAKGESEMSWVDRTMRASTFCRGALSTYTIICTLYIVAREATLWHLPPLGDKFFPW